MDNKPEDKFVSNAELKKILDEQTKNFENRFYQNKLIIVTLIDKVSEIITFVSLVGMAIYTFNSLAQETKNLLVEKYLDKLAIGASSIVLYTQIHKQQKIKKAALDGKDDDNTSDRDS